jgi:hypothetical protein
MSYYTSVEHHIKVMEGHGPLISEVPRAIAKQFRRPEFSDISFLNKRVFTEFARRARAVHFNDYALERWDGVAMLIYRKGTELGDGMAIPGFDDLCLQVWNPEPMILPVSSAPGDSFGRGRMADAILEMLSVGPWLRGEGVIDWSSRPGPPRLISGCGMCGEHSVFMRTVHQITADDEQKKMLFALMMPKCVKRSCEHAFLKQTDKMAAEIHRLVIGGTMTGPRRHACAGCGNTGRTASDLQRCSRCKSAYYCTSECQKRHWPTHRVICAKVL